MINQQACLFQVQVIPSSRKRSNRGDLSSDFQIRNLDIYTMPSSTNNSIQIYRQQELKFKEILILYTWIT